jgi:cell division protein FtsB
LGQAANTLWVNDSATAATRVRALARRRTRVRRILDALVLAVTLAATGLCVSVYFRTQAELRSAQSRHQSAIDRVADLKRENEKLEREVEQLKSDPAMIEAVAREKLGLVRPGEIVIKIGQEQEASGPSVVKIRAREGEGTSLTPRMGDGYTHPSN